MTNLEKCKLVLNNFAETLNEMGYTPEYYEGADLQVHFNVDGICFDVFCDEEESDVFSFGCIFEPDNELTEQEKADFDEQFAQENNLFDCIIFAEDNTVHVYGSASVNDFSNEFVIELVDTLLDKAGVIQKLKSISYIWE